MPGVLGLRETYQNWQNGSVTLSDALVLRNASTGSIRDYSTQNYQVKNINPVLFNYASYDNYQQTGGTQTLILYDSAGATQNTFFVLSKIDCVGNATYRAKHIEVVVSGGTPYIYCFGQMVATLTTKTTNPSYMSVATSLNPLEIDNVLIGESDRHVISTIPNNWTVTKDLISPASVGVYAQDPSTYLFNVVKNSNYLYIETGVDSQDTAPKDIIISDESGNVINTTHISSANPYTLLQYDLTQFFIDANNHYGLFSAHFENSSVYSYFSVTGAGATVSLDKTQYTEGDIATATYTITPSYWDTSTYNYRLDFISATTGAVVSTSVISSSSGTKTYTFKDTDTQGGYYAAVIAKARTVGATDVWMTYAYADLTNFAVFQGYVLNAETAAVINGAEVNVSQNSIIYDATTPATGNYSTTGTGFGSGTTTLVNVTASGYTGYIVNIIPVSGKTINLNITLSPLTPTHYYGLGIGGVVRTGVNDGLNNISYGYGQPIIGARVSVTNITNGESYFNITNSAGWYMCDNGAVCNLVNNRLYAVWGSKLGYTNSTTYNVIASGSLI
jgi:hypothetical protein